MKRFASLYEELDASTSTNRKVQALADYLKSADAAEAAWVVYFLAGGRPRRTVPTRTLREVALTVSGLPDWLFEEAYQAVGDLAETIAHVTGSTEPVHGLSMQGLDWWMTERILPLKGMNDVQRAESLIESWRQLTAGERFLFVKLVGGGFRVGVSKLTVIKALSLATGLDVKLLATRFVGYTDASKHPSASDYLALLESVDEGARSRVGQPLPFFLAHPLDLAPGEMEIQLRQPTDWLVEWKFDGIRAQIVREQSEVFIWSRGEELVTEQFPELVQMAAHWPDGLILDGEILVWRQSRPAGFKDLQARLNRKSVTKKLLSESPVSFMAYDLLMIDGRLLNESPLAQRRQMLERFCQGQLDQSKDSSASSRLILSQRVEGESWAQLADLRERSRELGVEGFMLKKLDSLYGAGRTKADGLWYKWKIEPMTVDCVLVYAQRGHGRRANLYTDYTFAVWDRSGVTAEEAALVCSAIERGETIEQTTARGLPRLVPFAKAYSGLSDEEFKQVDREIKRNTVNKFGPVRTVKPSLVFEIGFEAMSKSTRHKSGLAVRFPRMLRIRSDKPLHEADCLATLQALCPDWREDS